MSGISNSKEYGKKWRALHPHYMKDWLKRHPKYESPLRKSRREQRIEKRMKTLFESLEHLANNRKLDSLSSMSYVAGILDGEGSVMLQRRGPRFVPGLVLHNTDRKMLEYCQSLIGGTIYLGHGDTKTRKTKWVLRVGSVEKVALVLTSLSPFLITKQRQAHLSLEFCLRRIGNGRKSYSIRDIETYNQIRTLNQRGPKETVENLP